MHAHAPSYWLYISLFAKMVPWNSLYFWSDTGPVKLTVWTWIKNIYSSLAHWVYRFDCMKIPPLQNTERASQVSTRLATLGQLNTVLPSARCPSSMSMWDPTWNPDGLLSATGINHCNKKNIKSQKKSNGWENGHYAGKDSGWRSAGVYVSESYHEDLAPLLCIPW